MTARTGDVIETAARAVAAHMWDRDTAEAPTWGALTPSEQDAVIENEQTAGIARALADAGLLARPLPTRDEIARLVWECATTPCGTCPEGGVDWVTCCIYCADGAKGTADAVLDLFSRQDAP